MIRPSTAPQSHDTDARALWEALPCDRADERVGPGAELLTQGFMARHVLVVHSGLVKLVHGCSDGRSAIVGLRWSQSLIGTTAVLLDAPQPHTAIAVSPCDLSRIPATQFTLLLKEGGPLSWRVHLAHAREVIREFEQSAELACLSARERLESFMVRLRKELEPETAEGIELPLRDWELAQVLAITPQYMSRLLHELVGQGRLQRRCNRWLFSCPGGNGGNGCAHPRPSSS